MRLILGVMGKFSVQVRTPESASTYEGRFDSFRSHLQFNRIATFTGRRKLNPLYSVELVSS